MPWTRGLPGTLRLSAGVGFQAGRGCVGFDEPDVSVLEVGEQRLEVLAGNLACPDDFGMIDISSVVYPFVVDDVARGVADED